MKKKIAQLIKRTCRIDEYDFYFEKSMTIGQKRCNERMNTTNCFQFIYNSEYLRLFIFTLFSIRVQHNRMIELLKNNKIKTVGVSLRARAESAKASLPSECSKNIFIIF